MYQTNCLLDEKEVPLTFSKAYTQDGDYYSGVLYTQPVIEFNFTIATHDTLKGSFHPTDILPVTQTAILQAINE